MMVLVCIEKAFHKTQDLLIMKTLKKKKKKQY